MGRGCNTGAHCNELRNFKQVRCLTDLTRTASLAPMRPAGTREIAAVDLATCDRCGLCLPLCPPGAIRLAGPTLVILAGSCTGCRKCVAPCPVGALGMMLRA